MGEQKVTIAKDPKEVQAFTRRLLNDVRALEYMLKNDWFESDIVRVGAEQEMCIVNSKTFKPAKINVEVMKKMKRYKWLDTELAQFNLETNLTPHEFKGKALRKLEEENLGYMNKIRATVNKMGAEVILTGILPTLRKHDLDLENLTPNPRYRGLMESLHGQLLGKGFEIHINGIDELNIIHDSPLLEACNTSFQVHLQVAPDDFVALYNIAQTLTGPVIAVAANSPLVFGKRLWHESRIAMFQQSVDTRTSQQHLRDRSPRVNFGNGWLHDSILEIYKEDIARFRVLMTADEKEESWEKINMGLTPKLKALQVHNSTVYRWNRPCYGISSNGKPHLRIENRVLPAGPTVVDAMANAAFWLGAMVGMHQRYPDIRKVIGWDDVRDNFVKASRYGIDSKFTWFNDKKYTAADLVLKELLPIAKEGLVTRKVDKEDIDRYLNIIKERIKKHCTGARWQLRAFTDLKKSINRDEAAAVVTASIIENQKKEMPVHKWKMPKPEDLREYVPASLRVDEFMTTDLITVQKEDLIDLVTQMMNWHKVRYMPVEDSKGHLVGLVTARALLKYYSKKSQTNDQSVGVVDQVMVSNPFTVSPKATITEAMKVMRDNKIGCLPVVVGENKELAGIITEMDFLRVSARLIERLEKS